MSRGSTPMRSGLGSTACSSLVSRRAFIRGAALGAGSLAVSPLLGPLAALRAGGNPRRPNILFILTDDQGWPTLGCYGNTRVPTPHLDALAREGMKSIPVEVPGPNPHHDPERSLRETREKQPWN